MDENLWQMVLMCGGIERVILYFLLALSIVLWSLVFLKLHDLYVARKNSAAFLLLFENSETIERMRAAEVQAGDCPHRAVFLAALHVVDGKRVKLPPGSGQGPKTTREELLLLNMQHTAKAFFGRLQWGMGFMATLGSTSPFIGLFGTVWGIMQTFHDLGSAKSPSMQVVAPGISAALIATAAGLAVAIPAVIAYNWLNALLTAYQEQTDSFIERLDVLCRAQMRQAPAPTEGTPALAGSGRARS